jgi:hypothetical protein
LWRSPDFDSDDHSQGLKATGTTNDDGHFNIDPIVRLHLFTSILNPPDVVLQTTTVCFQTAAEPAFGMTIIARTNLGITSNRHSGGGSEMSSII